MGNVKVANSLFSNTIIHLYIVHVKEIVRWYHLCCSGCVVHVHKIDLRFNQLSA